MLAGFIFPATYQTGPSAARGRVKIQGPFAVTATVCSKWAESLPSAVTAVQSSSSTRTAGPPQFTIGSMARTMPSCNLGPWPALINRLVQRFPGHPQQLFAPGRNLAHRNRQSSIAEVPVQLHAEVHREDVALFDSAGGRRDSVHHLLVDRGAHRTRIPPVPLKCRAGAMFHRV